MKKKIIPFLLAFSLAFSSCASAANGAPVNDSQSNGSSAAATTPTITPTPMPEQQYVTGENEFYNGDYDNALIQLAAAQASTDPEIVAKAMVLTGRIYQYEKNYQKAIETFGSTINYQPEGMNRNTAFFFMGQVYNEMNEYQLAANALGDYLSLTPDSPIKADILEMQGDALVQAGNNADALNAYNQAITTARPEYLEELKLKAALATADSGDVDSAIAQYLALYDSAQLNATKSTANLYLGRLYLQKGDSDSAYQRFQDSVAQFPAFYDTFSQLAALVEANQPVDDRLRGIIDYNAGQYGMAISAFDRYIGSHPDYTADILSYKAFSYYAMGDYDNEVATWDLLIQKFPNDPNYYADAFIEKATTQYQKLQQYQTAAQTLLTYVTEASSANEAPAYLYQAARIYEQGNLLEVAAQTWERVTNEYPSYEKSTLAQFNAGICYYRLGEYAKALTTFQRNALLTSNAPDKARAEMWIGKTQQALNDKTSAQSSFEQAAREDPTSYYSIRAAELAQNEKPFFTSSNIDLGVNLASEKKEAAEWMRTKFTIATDVDLLSPVELASNILYQRGDAFWQLGMVDRAQTEFDSLQEELSSDAVNSFRLMNHLVDLGLNQSAIYCARQILDMIGYGDLSLLSQAPEYFNHIRFGTFFREIIVPTASENGFDSLVLFSIIRQESLFEPEITSSQGAEGLMQIMPSVGQEIQADYSWPQNYQDADLDRPLINIKLGTHYLAKWYNYFDQNMIAALASYNGGIGYTLNWESLSNNDSDLLLEIIPDNYETQNYIRQIREFLEVYKTIYSRK
jgi:soluble lytic murein transglycosylase